MATGGPISSIRLLQISAFVSTLDRFVMPPMLIAMAHDLEVPLSDIVQAAGAYYLAYGLMQPVWGFVSDWLGLVRTMRLTLVLAALATIASAFVWTPLALGVTRGLAGGFFGASYPASLIYIGDTVQTKERHRHVTDLMVGVALGTAVASVAGGAVAQLLTWRVAFVATGVGAFAIAFALGDLAEVPRMRGRRSILVPLLQVARSRPARLVLWLAFLEGAVLLGALTVLPAAVEAAGASAALAGAVTACYGLAVYGFARMVGRLSRRLHPSALIGLGAGAASLSCVLMTISQAVAIAVVATVLFALAWASMHSTLQTWATEVVPPARATVVSLFAGWLFVGSAVAAIVIAQLAEADRYGEIFAITAVTSVPLGIQAVRGRRKWQMPDQEPD